MIPVNRIKRWPFLGNPVLNALAAAKELRVEGEEMLSVFGALTMALGNPMIVHCSYSRWTAMLFARRPYAPGVGPSRITETHTQ